MITGVFNDREARVPLIVRGPNGREKGIAAVIDTGFSGFLTLPSTVVQDLELDRLGEGAALVGDGTIQIFDLYEAILIWDDQPLTVDIATAETEPLVGMSLIYGHDLRIRATEGGAVTIESLTCM